MAGQRFAGVFMGRERFYEWWDEHTDCEAEELLEKLEDLKIRFDPFTETPPKKAIGPGDEYLSPVGTVVVEDCLRYVRQERPELMEDLGVGDLSIEKAAEKLVSDVTR